MATSNLSQLPFHLRGIDSNNSMIDYEICDTDGNNNDYLETIDPDVNFYSDKYCKYYTTKSFNENLASNEHKLSFIHMNIRSAPKNLEEFKCYLKTLKMFFFRSDI